MTAPASPPLTLAEIVVKAEAYADELGSVDALRFALRNLAMSTRLAAERAEGLARAAEEVLGAPLGPSPIVIDVAREHLRAALAAYRGSAGGGTTATKAEGGDR